MNNAATSNMHRIAAGIIEQDPVAAAIVEAIQPHLLQHHSARVVEATLRALVVVILSAARPGLTQPALRECGQAPLALAGSRALSLMDVTDAVGERGGRLDG